VELFASDADEDHLEEVEESDPEVLHEPPAHCGPGVTRATLQGRDVVLTDGQATGQLALGQPLRPPPLGQARGPDADVDGTNCCHWVSIRQDSRSV
jgi:hypothetical protein